MKRDFIKIEDLEALATGSIFLGSGGGGDPAYDLLLTQDLMAEGGPIPLLQVDELEDDDLIAPLAFMGAPLVSIEKVVSGTECKVILEMIEEHFGKKVRAIVPLEIGGSNAFSALQAAAVEGLPVVDADSMGRAFPELQMSSCSLFSVPCAPAFIADSVGRSASVSVANPKLLEERFRVLCTEMGSVAAVAFYIMNGKQAKECLIRGSYSKAIEIGKRLYAQEALEKNRVLFRGIISDIEQEITGGFLKGKITISERFSIHFQNEYLLVYDGEKLVGATPEIIALLNAKTGMPLPVEQVKFGVEVVLTLYPPDALWQTPAGLKLVGLDAFNIRI